MPTVTPTYPADDTGADVSDYNLIIQSILAVFNGNIDADNLATSAITTPKIANDAVTTAKLADANVTTAKLADANVTTAKLADANVTTAKIANGAVTPAKLTQRTAVGTISAGATSTVTGLNFQPKTVEFYRFANSGGTAMGYGISTDEATDKHFAVSAGSTTTVSSTNSVINSTGSGTTNVAGKVTAFTSDGFTLTMTTSASLTFLYVARG